MNEQAAAHYAKQFDYPEEYFLRACEPASLLYGNKLSIRKVFDDANQENLIGAIRDYTQPFVDASNRVLLRRYPTIPDERHDQEVRVVKKAIGALRTALNPRKLVMGTVEELTIEAVTDDELPTAIHDRFAPNMRGRTARQRIDDYDVYYRIFGRVRSGSRLGHLACGAMVQPYVDSHKREYVSKETGTVVEHNLQRLGHQLVFAAYALPEIEAVAQQL
jgi:hypothetical protein